MLINEAQQGLADGRTAEAELVGEFFFDKECARLEISGDDTPAQRCVNKSRGCEHRAHAGVIRLAHCTRTTSVRRSVSIVSLKVKIADIVHRERGNERFGAVCGEPACAPNPQTLIEFLWAG